MTRKEFEHELLLRYVSAWYTKTFAKINLREAVCDVRNIMKGLEDIYGKTLFDDSEPEPDVELQEGGYPTFTPIQEVKELSIRTKHALLGGGVNTVAELLPLSRRDILKFRNFGGKCLTNVNDFLEKYGFQLKTRAW